MRDPGDICLNLVAGQFTVDDLMARGLSRESAQELFDYAQRTLARAGATEADAWMVLCVGGPFAGERRDVPPGWPDTLGVEGHDGHYRLVNTGEGWRWMWNPRAYGAAPSPAPAPEGAGEVDWTKRVVACGACWGVGCEACQNWGLVAPKSDSAAQTERSIPMEPTPPDAVAASLRAKLADANHTIGGFRRALDEAERLSNAVYDLLAPLVPESERDGNILHLAQAVVARHAQAEGLGWNAALEWGAGFIDAGYPTSGDTADPRALAMSIRAGRKPLRWDVEVTYIGFGSDGIGPCVAEREVEAVDEATACELVEAWIVADREVVRIDDIRAALRPATPAAPNDEVKRLRAALDKIGALCPHGEEIEYDDAGQPRIAMLHDPEGEWLRAEKVREIAWAALDGDCPHVAAPADRAEEGPAQPWGAVREYIAAQSRPATPAAPEGAGDDRAAVQMVDDLIEAVQQRTFDLANPNTPNATRNASERGMQDARSRLLASLRDAAALSAPRAPEADRAAGDRIRKRFGGVIDDARELSYLLREEPRADAERNEQAAVCLDGMTAYADELLAALRAQAERVAALEQELAKAQAAMHAGFRWNVEPTDDGVSICRGEHDKSASCAWEYYVPAADLLAARAAAERSEGEVEFLRTELRAAARVFRDYGDLHTQKNTPEGDEKASANYWHAERFFAASRRGPAGARAGEGEA